MRLTIAPKYALQIAQRLRRAVHEATRKELARGGASFVSLIIEEGEGGAVDVSVNVAHQKKEGAKA